MRIVLDMQGAQTESRFRGVGRYTMSLAQAIVRNHDNHEIFLALNGLFPDTIEPIRAAFNDLLPQKNIRVWYAPGPVRECQPGNEWRREVAERVREAFLANLQPDVVHVSSLFEGYVDDAVTSIGVFAPKIPTVVTLYDLIPLLNSETYLKPNPRYKQYYLRKVENLRRAAMWLAISEFSRVEGTHALNLDGNKVVNISTAIDPHFQPQNIDDATASQLRLKFGISRPFVLHTGGADKHKNLARLIEAYAALETNLRAEHQLVLAGKMPEGDVARLKHIMRSVGLKGDELVFTGYVTDEKLVQLYNLCQLYVFPSWHEGFGLPALEAMACGAPVIGANTSSLPEVIGLEQALFNPFDVKAITQKMVLALGNDNFRGKLREHGLQQARKFSWDETAKRAIAASEALPLHQMNGVDYVTRTLAHGRLIDALAGYDHISREPYLVALSACLAQNGIAGVERQLMLDVSELCQRDSATGVQRVVRSYLKWLLQTPPAGFRAEPVYASQGHGYRYARCFTQRFLGQDSGSQNDEPVQWQRGDIFFGLDMQHHVQLAHTAFYRQLRVDGVTVKFLVYDLLPIQLVGLFKDSNARDLHEQWLRMIARTDGAICISQATAIAFDNWIIQNDIFRSSNFQLTWVHIGGDIDGSKPSFGLALDAPVVLDKIRARPSFLCVSTLEPRKGQQQILDAMQVLWDEGMDVSLTLVGQQGWNIETLAESINKHPEKDRRLFWLQGISDEYLEQVYSASTCLIAASINEGFGLPLIEAARHSIPIVARDIPVFREVAGDCAFYFTGDSPHDLATAIKEWLRLHRDAAHPKSSQLCWSTWQESAEKIKAALVLENYPRRQLLVDVSELIQRDAGSGIQRVTRSILNEWLNHPPVGYRVEPVYATIVQGYRYARRFTQSFLGCPDASLQDEPVDYAPGDVFFGLDFQPAVVSAQRAFYKALRRQGVRVLFLVHDLLCIRMPQYFLPGSAEGFTRWLEVIAEGDGVVCVSKTVADELGEWVKENGPTRHRLFKINWSHNGTDLNNRMPTKGLPSDVASVLDNLRNRPSFLMVGTLEPRKGHALVLETFEQLWRSGFDLNLVIVGKQGWLMEKFVECLREQPELNKRLFWLTGISDEYLEKIYSASTCLIAASEGEGFGLPLIEAAQHKLPIIARDIPVFREVAGDHAFYFNAQNSAELTKAVRDWLALYAEKRVPFSAGMPFLTWKQSADRLKQFCINDVTQIDT